jgi:hypothetical protein
MAAAATPEERALLDEAMTMALAEYGAGVVTDGS